MTNRELTQKIKSLLLDYGAALAGIAPNERFKNAPYLISPEAILPEAKNVIVAAIHITDTWTEMGGEPEPQDRSPGGQMDQNSLLDRMAYRTVQYLERQGFKSVAVASSNIWRYRQFEEIPSLFAPDLSHIHAACAAGLGEIGWSGLLITPEFGVRCRFISIVTEATLVPSPMYNGPKLCDMCMECAKHCPTYSLKKELQKPHEVEIGDKIFKYANKNIWRCAWAEHFMLNLNSERVKTLEHIGEKEILEAIEAKEQRGHERGVCQKYCIPPHLRTKEKSFGRDKYIVQNRINKKYPDNMSTLKKLRDDIMHFALKQGIDVCSVKTLPEDNPITKQIEVDAPGMKTVIGFAFRIPENSLKTNQKSEKEFANDIYAYAIDRKMHLILLRTARQIEDYGYHAASYTGLKSGTLESSLTALSGIGELDKYGNIVSPEYGNIWGGAITTDAPLPEEPATKILVIQRNKKTVAKEQLTAEIKNIAKDNYISLTGIAPVSIFNSIVKDLKKNINETELGEIVRDKARWMHGEFNPKIIRNKDGIRSPKDYLNNAKSVIMLSLHFPGRMAVIENAGNEKSQQIGTYGFAQYQTCFELRFAALEVMNELDEYGYKSAVTENMLGIGSFVDSPRFFLPDARCNAIEAVAAGLGEIGQSGVLLTPEYGPHQRSIVIITDAELTYNNVYGGVKLCKECGNCIVRCPMKALIKEDYFNIRIGKKIIKYPHIERHRCDWAKQYSLNPAAGPGLLGVTTDVSAPDRKITIEDIAEACREKDPIMKCRTCILEQCMRYCSASSVGSGHK